MGGGRFPWKNIPVPRARAARPPAPNPPHYKQITQSLLYLKMPTDKSEIKKCYVCDKYFLKKRIDAHRKTCGKKTTKPVVEDEEEEE